MDTIYIKIFATTLALSFITAIASVIIDAMWDTDKADKLFFVAIVSLLTHLTVMVISMLVWIWISY